MSTRAVLAVRVPAPIITDEVMMRWRSDVPDLSLEGLACYTDGSLLHARHYFICAVGIDLCMADKTIIVQSEARC